MDDEREKEREKVRHAARIRRLKYRLLVGGVALLLLSFVFGIIGLIGVIRLSGQLKESQAMLLQMSAQLTRLQAADAAYGYETTENSGSGPNGNGMPAGQADMAAQSAGAAPGAVNGGNVLAAGQAFGSVSDSGMTIVSQDTAMSSPYGSDPYEGMTKVCLTFDDGPSMYTDEILNILNHYGVKGTFFVNAREGFDEEYRRIVAEGHTLGMHSYSHKYAEIYADLDSFAEDLYRIQDFLEDKTGETSIYYRFPGGSSNTVSRVEMTRLIEYLNAKGIIYYDWNVASGDAAGGYHSAESLANSVITQINSLNASTVVVLMHDAADKATTVEALPLIIERIQAMDNTVILPITENITPIQHVSIAAEADG